MRKEKIFSIREIAKLTGVTIRTLQYYDNIGLVPLARDNASGRRYYKESDLTRLQQVLFYKSLGLKIADIKNLLVETVTPEQIGGVLRRQLDIFYHMLNDLKANIALIEASLVSLEENNRIPWGNLIQLMLSFNKDTIFKYKDIKYDKKTEHIFVKHYKDSKTILDIYWDWKSLILEAATLILNDIQPESEQGLMFAKKWINMTNKITRGNKDLLEAHKTSYENREQWPEEDRRLMEFTNYFIDKATKTYLTEQKIGSD
ncbi:MAG: MerR family transcriptional regulator [Clostridiaceae bacterium]|nr:MerR family transcriptional regulator [Clostridiaceae bacterium]